MPRMIVGLFIYLNAVAIRTAPVRRPPFAIRTGVSISSLVALVSVELHSLGLGS